MIGVPASPEVSDMRSYFGHPGSDVRMLNGAEEKGEKKCRQLKPTDQPNTVSTGKPSKGKNPSIHVDLIAAVACILTNAVNHDTTKLRTTKLQYKALAAPHWAGNVRSAGSPFEGTT